MTQEFHVSITPVRDDEYLIRAEKVSPGVPLAEQQIIWPVEDWLQQAQQLMGDPLTGLLRDNRLPAAIAAAQRQTPESEMPEADRSLLSLMDLGQQLYNHLFQGILRDSWMTAQGIAQHRGEVLRLRLGLKGPLLPRLPWEVMHSSGSDGVGLAAHPLATGTNVLFSRYQPSVAIAPSNFAQHPAGQIRMLMVISAPSDQGQLKLKQEAQQLQQELGMRPATLNNGPAEGLPDIQVTILEQPGRKELAQALEQGHYQILHYAGHSDVAAAGGQLYLVNSRTGLTESLSGNDLAGLLVNNGVRIAVFNSCCGSYRAANGDGSGRNLTEALISRGVPSVLAMAEQIPDDVALTLTRLLYRNLKQGYPIDLSLSRARQGLVAAYGSTQLYWALPTLYVHPDFNGYLTTRDRHSDNLADSLARMPHFHAIPLSSSALAASSTATPSLGEGMSEDDSAQAAVDPIYPLQDELDDLDQMDLDGEALEITESSGLVDYGDHQDEARALPYGTQDSTDAPLAASNRTQQAAIAPVSGRADASTLVTEQPVANEPAIDRSQTPPSEAVPFDAASNHANAAILASPRWTQLLPRRAALLLLIPLGLALAVSTMQLAREPSSSGDVAATSSVDTDAVLDNISDASTEAVEQAARISFTKNDIDAGEEALTELFNRGTLAEAEAALEAVPDEQISDPRINFLHGRLAWESLKRGDPSADVYEARRFWDFAVQQSPQPLYYNALGFALYTEGRTAAAMDAWLETLMLLEGEGIAVYPGEASANSSQITVAVPDQITNQDALTAYAGLAVAMAFMSSSPTPEQPPDLLSKAVQIQQVVMQGDPVTFQPENLRQNWLWTDGMVKEWEILQGLRSQ
ncbi:MAG: CHAT domain-containing protein [Elainellaceae cyanobacterium]